MNWGKSAKAEETPIRGPTWTNATVRRSSDTVETKPFKGFAALQRELSGFCGQINVGLEKEASVAKDIARASKQHKLDGDTTGHHNAKDQKHGAFDFLDERTNQKNRGHAPAV